MVTKGGCIRGVALASVVVWKSAVRSDDGFSSAGVPYILAEPLCAGEVTTQRAARPPNDVAVSARVRTPAASPDFSALRGCARFLFFAGETGSVDPTLSTRSGTDADVPGSLDRCGGVCAPALLLRSHVH